MTAINPFLTPHADWGLLATPPQPTFSFGGMQLPTTPDPPLYSRSPLFSPTGQPGYGLPMTQPRDPVFPMTPPPPLPSLAGTPLTQYMSRATSPDENDRYNQETDMSATDDVDGAPAFPAVHRPSPEEIGKARDWLHDLGLDADGVRAIAEKVQQAMEGLSAEKERAEAEMESLWASILNWDDALHTVRMGADDPRGTEEERGPLLRAEDGLEEAVRLARERHAGIRDDIVAVDARICVVQELVGHLHESPPAPWCPICMTRPVDVVAQPCGHAYCRRCAARMTQARRRPCFVCRTQCKSTMALHFS